VGKADDRLIGVVHGHGDTLALEVEDVERNGSGSVLGLEVEGELAGTGDDKVGRAVLVTESVTTNADGLGPSGNGLGDVLEDDGLTEDGAVEDVTDLRGLASIALVRIGWSNPGLPRPGAGPVLVGNSRYRWATSTSP
jgi:hypothetical protein